MLRSCFTYLTKRIHRLLDVGQIDRPLGHADLDGIVDDALDSDEDLHGGFALDVKRKAFVTRSFGGIFWIVQSSVVNI